MREMDSLTSLFQAIKDNRLRRVVEYWDRKRTRRRAPLRKEIDPVDLGFALAHISLVEARGDLRRFLFRVDGSVQVQLFGVDCTGKYLDQCFPEDHVNLATKSYGEALDTGMPQHFLRDVIVD